MSTSTKELNSKTVTIFRTKSFLEKAQGADVQPFMALSRMSVGAYFESSNSMKIGNGLSFQEEELLMPHIVDCPPSDREFRKLVTAFFNDITTNVPYEGGVTLEVGLSKDNKLPVSKDNMPIKIIDYLRYRHAMGHPEVALSEKLSRGNQLFKYYIFDKEEIQATGIQRNKDKDAAIAVYLKIKESTEQVDTMLTLLGKDVRDYVGKDKENLKLQELRALTESDPLAFIKQYDGGDLEQRGTIQSMLNVGVLKKMGERFVNTEDNSTIANSLDEMISFMLDDDNSGVVNMLQARRQEAMDKPATVKKKRTVA